MSKDCNLFNIGLDRLVGQVCVIYVVRSLKSDFSLRNLWNNLEDNRKILTVNYDKDQPLNQLQVNLISSMMSVHLFASREIKRKNGSIVAYH